MNRLTLTVASWADRDDLVVEIEAGDEDFGVVTCDRDTDKLVLALYPRASGEDWRCDLDELQEALARAKCRILDVAGPVSAEKR